MLVLIMCAIIMGLDLAWATYDFDKWLQKGIKETKS